MELEIKQDKLAKALNIVSRSAAGSRSSLPILNNVLIKAEGKKVSLVTTNLDVAVVDYVPVIKSTDGAITVPARLLADFVSNLPKSENVSISVKDNKVTTKAGKYSSTINGVSAEDFPELPGIDEENAVHYTINVDDFKAGLSQVVFASSNDMTRPALTGVCFNTFEGSLYVAATDGYRLTEKKIVEKVENDVSVIVPSSSLQEVLRSLSDDIENIDILIDDSQIRFRMGELEITSKLIDGAFPDYRQLIPKESDIEFDVEKSELIRITKIAALFAKNSNGAIDCSTSAEDSSLIISAVSNEMGENKSEISVSVDKDGSVKLDSRFLIDALNALESSRVRFGFSGKVSPVVLRNEKKNDYVHIIMPLNS